MIEDRDGLYDPPYVEGELAYWNGVKYAACPYWRQSNDARQWRNGWIDAQRDEWRAKYSEPQRGAF